MTSDRDDEGYWTAPSGDAGVADGPPSADLASLTIEGVRPLDGQLGASNPLTVPAVLREALFGQPEPIAGGAGPPLHTYAVLDAAKVLGLPEMLEASGLEQACLFRGDAAEELRDVAPWIVRLEEGHGFVRGLFTRGDGPHQLWDAEPGICLRARGSLDDMRRHCRRYTRVQDVGGRWLYFRFWEPRWCVWSVGAMDGPQRAAFLAPLSGIVTLDVVKSRALVLEKGGG